MLLGGLSQADVHLLALTGASSACASGTVPYTVSFKRLPVLVFFKTASNLPLGMLSTLLGEECVFQLE